MHTDPRCLRIVLRSKRLDPPTVAFIEARICDDGELHLMKTSIVSLSA
jgi:hypothetical protein